jgi:hypothetical protein
VSERFLAIWGISLPVVEGRLDSGNDFDETISVDALPNDAES